MAIDLILDMWDPRALENHFVSDIKQDLKFIFSQLLGAMEHSFVLNPLHLYHSSQTTGPGNVLSTQGPRTFVPS